MDNPDKPFFQCDSKGSCQKTEALETSTLNVQLSPEDTILNKKIPFKKTRIVLLVLDPVTMQARVRTRKTPISMHQWYSKLFQMSVLRRQWSKPSSWISWRPWKRILSLTVTMIIFQRRRICVQTQTTS